ncbi:hypothetical protein RJ639_022244 [Escallonia herrerae]|uniref:U1-C C2H2-type zinc finger domain-containing protein n=1 Tax=Escallonia herrerae TaxID=1293975 RepID=A0AA88V539_9ASTE|nr:hypothetical protein RJ639_022244 [Escallonia herrerae]
MALNLPLGKTPLEQQSFKCLTLILSQPSVRKQHNAGYKHKANVRTYYEQFEQQQTQILIDQRIKEHLGQAAQYQQIGGVYNQHLMAGRPRMPMPMMAPVLPIPGAAPLPLVPGVRPPVFPSPAPGAPGYGAPPMMPVAGQLPGAPSMPMQNYSIPNHPTSNTQAGGVAPPGSDTAPAVTQAMYQGNPAGSAAPAGTQATYQGNPAGNAAPAGSQAMYQGNPSGSAAPPSSYSYPPASH